MSTSPPGLSLVSDEDLNPLALIYGIDQYSTLRWPLPNDMMDDVRMT